MIRRLAILGSVAAAVVALVATPAPADDLSDYLEEADRATYSGRRHVGTNWDGWERMGVVEVEQLGGMAMFGSGENYLMLGGGRFHAVGSSSVGLAYVSGGSVRIANDYVMAMGETAMHLGRAAQVMEVREAGMLRMRMVVDVVTFAPLVTEVYDDEGNLFRYSTMVEFSTSAPGMADYHDDGQYEMMVPIDDAPVPGEVGRYQLVDAYRGPADRQQAFYTDGLFSFSLFVIDGRSDVARMTPEGRTWEDGGHEYLRVVAPAKVWVLWSTSVYTYALVGDLPPDHFAAVLEDLPRPERRNWFKNLWHRLFG